MLLRISNEMKIVYCILIFFCGLCLGKLSYYIVDSFIPSTCSIVTKTGEIPIRSETVEAMFGLPSTGLDFNTLTASDPEDPLVVAWKNQYKEGKVYKFNDSNYLEKIRDSEDVDDIFKLNFLTLFINTFCETELMGSRKTDFFEKLVFAKDQIEKINWCKYLVECLVRTKGKWKANDKTCNYVGPETLLLVSC